MLLVGCWSGSSGHTAESRGGIVMHFRVWGIGALLLGSLLLSGCAERRVSSVDGSGVSVGRSAGGIYRVSRSRSGQNYFIVTTVGGAAGTRTGAEAAVHRAYGCQRAMLRQTAPNWRRSEGRASFCRGNPSHRGR